MQILVVGSETHVCNATECTIAVQGHFRVNQGRWFLYQSKARIQFPITIIIMTFVHKVQTYILQDNTDKTLEIKLVSAQVRNNILNVSYSKNIR